MRLVFASRRADDVESLLDVPVGKDDFLSVAMHVGGFDEPGFAAVLEGRAALRAERHGQVVDALVGRIAEVRRLHSLLNGRANPVDRRQSVRVERADPGVHDADVRRGISGNLRPVLVILHVQVGGVVQGT